MNCTYVKKHLNDYIDNSISPGHMFSIEEHLTSCTSCSEIIISTRSLIAKLQSLPVPKLSEPQWATMNNAIIKALPPHVTKAYKVYTSQSNSIKSYFTPLRSIAALLVVSVISTAIIFKSPLSQTAFFSKKHQNGYPTINSITGNAFVVNNTNTVSPLSNNFSLHPGSAIQTDSVSSLNIQVDAKSTIGLERSTHFRVKEYAVNKTVFTLEKGNLGAHVSKRTPDQLFRIETPNAFCEVVGTKFDVSTQFDTYRNRSITTLSVQEGRVRFGSTSKSVFVDAGNAIALFGDSLSETVSDSNTLIQQLSNNPGLGTIAITSQPTGAAIILDGTIAGITPFTGKARYGIHNVAIKKLGYLPWTGVLTINAGTLGESAILLRSLKKSADAKESKSITVPATFPNQPTIDTGTVTYSDPIDFSAINHAVNLMNNGYYQDARAELDALIFDPSTPSSLKVIAYQKLSNCYKNMGDYENAVKMLTLIIDNKFESEFLSQATFERATIYRNNLFNTSKAIDDLTTYTSRYKKGIWIEEATLSLAELFYIKKEYKKAIEVYTTFCSTFKDNAQYENSLYTLGTIYYTTLSDYSNALTIFNRLQHEFPKSQFTDNAVFWSADCLLKQGNPSRAIVVFNSYLNRFPTGRWASEAKSHLYRIETSEAR